MHSVTPVSNGDKVNTILILAALAAVSFVQNAAFTAVSRSRNSGDVAHHAK
jgi:hypothetical protein